MKAQNGMMHFLFTLNEAYAPHLAATIVSILESQKADRALHFHIISSDFSEETKKKIDSLKKRRAFETSYYDETDLGIALPALPLTKSFITKETYYRCFAHEFIKETDRIIHLDVDLLVLRDLNDLWSMNLKGNIAAGVRCPLMDGRHLIVAGFNPRKHLYSLMGANLFDLAAMRKFRLTDKIASALKGFTPFLRGQDQDLLNLALRGHFAELPPSYNFTTAHIQDARVKRKKKSDSSYQEAKRAPHIVHFSREVKAWHSFGFNPYRPLYWECLKKTPWKDMKPWPFPYRKYFSFLKSLYEQTRLFNIWRGWRLSCSDPSHRANIREALRRNRVKNYRGPQKGDKIFTHISPKIDLFFYFEKMLGCTFTKNPKEAQAALLWGTKFFPDRGRCLRDALESDLPLILAEDGFIRSIDVAFLHEPGLSCIMDPFGIYYDADFNCVFDEFLNSSWEISEEERAETQEAIRYIRETGLSKYNATLPSPLSFNANGKYKNVVLVLDQRKGDQSVSGAKADANTFRRMLSDAVRENPDSLILVKTHPDSNTGFFGGYYNKLRPKQSNIAMLKDNLNPISLLEAVDIVYVVSSQMGMEALFCEKRVYCYGASFFAGWGATEDRGAKRNRNRPRTVEEIFFASYIKFARYFDPSAMKSCRLMDALRYLRAERESRLT